MSIYSIWPYFLVAGAVTSLFSTRAFEFLDPAPSPVRIRAANIDGIRGFLAVSVMIDHSIVTYRWLRTGEWIVPPAAFYDQLGTLAVSVFFMITGFLFWGKMIRSNGHPGYIALYINRLFRIAPVYLAAVAAMTLIVLHRTGFVLHEPLSKIALSVLTWSGLGLTGGPDFNGYQNVWIILAGVTWTLKYEWYFYFSLMLIGGLASTRVKLGAPAIGMAVCFLGAQFWPFRDWYLAALFCAGMIVSAALSEKEPGVSSQRGRSALALALLAAVFAGWSTPFGLVQVVLLAIFFYLICSGTSIFGLLQTRAAQRLGHISYSTYLLQGIVLTLVFARPGIKAFSLSSAGAFWVVIGVCALILAILSTVTYALIERPGIKVGKRLSARLAKRNRAALTA